MIKLGGIICDRCRKLIYSINYYKIVKSKKGHDLHFCSATCYEKVTKPKIKGE